jgi:hypothetical protein
VFAYLARRKLRVTNQQLYRQQINTERAYFKALEAAAIEFVLNVVGVDKETFLSKYHELEAKPEE